jgi:hypothetical protein
MVITQGKIWTICWLGEKLKFPYHFNSHCCCVRSRVPIECQSLVMRLRQEQVSTGPPLYIYICVCVCVCVCVRYLKTGVLVSVRAL